MDAEVGRRIIPAEIDRQAKVKPNKIYASIPRSSDLSKGFQDVTILDFAKSIDRLCEYLEPLIGYSCNFNTVAYYGPPDLRYLIVNVALSKLGHKALFSAPRNSLSMHLHLFNVTECNTILHARQLDVLSMIGTHEATRHAIPELSELLWATTEPRHYPYTKTFDEAKNDPYLILHTSGSTGLPKPIVHTFGYTAAIDILAHVPPVNGRLSKLAVVCRPTRSLKAFPPWHVAGSIIFGVATSIWGDSIYVWPPADRMPSAKDLLDIVEYGNCTEILAPPTSFADIVKDPILYKKLDLVEWTMYGGGPLDAKVGNELAKKTKVMNVYGSTEACLPGVQLLTDPEDWQYNYFEPSPGIKFVEQTNGQYELTFVRHPDDEHMHPIWHTFPELNEWRIKDIFSPHPTKPNLWLYQGRMDDLIVFANGTKHNPLAFEERLRTHPLIRTALIAGTGRQQAAALIEPSSAAAADTPDALARLRDAVWPVIEAANAAAPAHARVRRSHVLFAQPARPFLRASKGTVQRAPTLRAYAAELDALYAREGDRRLEGSLPRTLGAPAEAQAGAEPAGDGVESDEHVLRLELRRVQLQKEMVELQLREVALQLDLRKLEAAKVISVH